MDNRSITFVFEINFQSSSTNWNNLVDTCTEMNAPISIATFRLKDGQPLNIDGTHYKQIVESDGTVILQIDAATEGDMGEITCVAKNPEGDSQSSATLSVLGEYLLAYFIYSFISIKND